MKKTSLESFIPSLKPSGHVLQIGFGEEANLIQASHPKSHTIIVSDPAGAKQAKAWAPNHKSAHLIFDPWQAALPKLGRYDLIYFHAPIEPELQAQAVQGMNAVNQGKKLIQKIEKTFPNLTTIKYEDADLDHLCKMMGKTRSKELLGFMTQLKKNGQITAQQHEHIVKKHQLGHAEGNNVVINDPLFFFFEACLKSHMHKGSRITCVATDRISRYDNPAFFQGIISNSQLDYKEIPVTLNGQEILALSVTML